MAVRKVNVNGVVYDVEDKEGVEANAQKINDLKSGAEAAGIAHKLVSGMVYRGYINEDTTLPSDDNSFYLTNDPGNYIDSEGNAVTVTTEGVSLIQRKNGEWKVYALWELVSELNNASSTRFASAKAVKTLKDMIDRLAQGGGSGGGGSITVDSELSESSLNPVQNAVITAVLNELGEAIEKATEKDSVTTDKIVDYAVTEEKLSFELSNKIDTAKIVADKAAADIGADSITLLQGGIDSDGKENTSSYYLRTSRSSTFKLEVNDGYTIGQLAQYDLSGNFVALYSDYTQPLESVEWNPQSVVATDKNYYWVAVVFKGNSPTVAIYPREAVVKSFASGLYYYMEGGEDDANSAAQQAKMVVDRTIKQLPNEEDLTLFDGKMQLANRAAAVKDGKVANLGYVILRPDRSFKEQVTEPNCIYEIRYEFDLQGGTVELKDNCTLKFNGGKLTNFKNLTLSNTIIEAQREHIFVVGEMLNKGVVDATEPSGNCNGEFDSSITGSIKNTTIYPEWFGAVADGNTDNSDAIQYALNTAYSIGGEIEFNGSAKKVYKVAHTIFLPPNVKMTTKNAMPRIYNENYGSRNRAEINFTCRYLFRTKKNKNTDAESTRLTNKVCVEMSGLKISGVYSRPKITIDGTAETGYETEIKINGDPFWVRKTYVFYGVHFAKSRISDIVTIYIGTFIYGGVAWGSLITRNNIAFHRAFIAGMKADANNSTSKTINNNDVIGGSSDKPLYELGYDTTITYSDGRTYTGYIEEVPALNNVGGIIDSRITHNYLNGNKDRVICFYEVQLAMSGVNNNYIDFCFAVFFQRAALNTRCVTVSNNIIDYCLMFCVINYAGALITENQVNKMNYSEVVNKYVRGIYDEDTTNYAIFAKNILNYKASFIVCSILRNVDVVNNSFYDTDAMNNFTGGQFWTSVHIKDNGYYNTPNDVICIKGADGSYGMNPCSDIYIDCFENVQVDENYIYDKKIVPYELLTVGSQLKMNTTYPSDIIDKEYNSKYEYINGELTVKNGKLNASTTPAALIIPGSRGICYNEDTKVWGYVNRLTTETYGHPYMPNGIRARKGVGDTRPTTAGFNDDDIGFVFFDKSIGKPVWWNGTAWVDSTGVEV